MTSALKPKLRSGPRCRGRKAVESLHSDQPPAAKMAISPVPHAPSIPCEWRKVSENEYRRPLFANEIFLAVKSLVGYSFLQLALHAWRFSRFEIILKALVFVQFDGTCTMISSITIKNSNVEDVKRAWSRFPQLMPLVRMQLHGHQIEGDHKLEFSYTVSREAVQEFKSWSKRTCKAHHGLDRRQLQKLAIEGRNQLRPTEANDTSDVAHLYVSEDRSGVHLVFSFQHAVTDARGQWMVRCFA